MHLSVSPWAWQPLPSRRWAFQFLSLQLSFSASVNAGDRNESVPAPSSPDIVGPKAVRIGFPMATRLRTVWKVQPVDEIAKQTIPGSDSLGSSGVRQRSRSCVAGDHSFMTEMNETHCYSG